MVVVFEQLAVEMNAKAPQMLGDGSGLWNPMVIGS
jgi:hypothetical protein